MRFSKIGPALATMVVLALPAGALATVRFDAQRIQFSPSGGVLLGDVDSDRQADAVGGDDLALRFADGRFRSYFTWTTALTGSPVLLVDDDRDGARDVLTETYVGSNLCELRTYRGSGFGSFTPPAFPLTFSLGCRSAWAAVDVDGDGVVAEYLGGLFFPPDANFYWYSSSVGFAPMSGTSGPIRVTAADVNADRQPDLLALTQDGLVHQALRAPTSGGFLPDTTFAGAPEIRDLAAGDLTGDGRAEVVTVGATAVVTRTGTGATVSFPLPAGGGSSVALADVDGDGALDMLVGLAFASAVPRDALLVRINAGAGTFLAPVTVPTAPAFRLAAAQRPDGRVDAVAAGTGADTTLLVNRSTATAGFFPSTLAFPATPSGQESAPAALGLRNVGDDVLRVERAHLSGLDADSFRLVADGCQGAVLRRNASCALSVRFVPRTPGPKTAFVRVLHSGDGGATQATLTGTGTVTAAAPAPAARVAGTGAQARAVVVRCRAAMEHCTVTVARTRGVRRVRVQLRRNGRVMARASGRTGRALRLRAPRRLDAGRYRLRVERIYRRGMRTVITTMVRLR